MLYLLVGENLYERDQTIARIAGDGAIESIDGSTVDANQLVDIFAGVSLFATKRTVAIHELSRQKSVWTSLEQWIEKGTDSTVLLIEMSVDKRTKTYKALQKHAEIISCEPWTDRQVSHAERWLTDHAKQLDVKLSRTQIASMVQRAIHPSSASENKMIIDQQLLAQVMSQLCDIDGPISDDMIETILAPATHEDVFSLLTAALRRDTQTVSAKIDKLSHTQNPQRMMGLLASQILQFAALVHAGSTSPDTVASDIGAHPFALKQLTGVARENTPDDARIAVEALTRADERMKLGAEPWSTIESALIQIAMR